jgi:hypothetical protein
LTVFINGKGAHRMGDPTRHCGGIGQLIEGSPNVIVGESGSAGGGRGGRPAPIGGSSASNGQAHDGAASAARNATSEAVRSSPTAARSGADPNAGATASPPANQAESPPVAPGDPTAELSWIELRLVGEDGSPIAGERYRVTPSSGNVREGYLDASGSVRLHGLRSGDCELTFPDLDKQAWSDLDNE